MKRSAPHGSESGEVAEQARASHAVSADDSAILAGEDRGGEPRLQPPHEDTGTQSESGSDPDQSPSSLFYPAARKRRRNGESHETAQRARISHYDGARTAA